MRTDKGGKRYVGNLSCKLAGGVCRSSISPYDLARGVCRPSISPCDPARGVCRSSICPCDPARGVCRSSICPCDLARGVCRSSICPRDLARGVCRSSICSRDLVMSNWVYQMCSCNLLRSFQGICQCWFKHCCQTNQSKSVLSSSWSRFLRRFFDLASASDVLLKTASCSLRENCHFSRQQISCSWRVRLYFSCKDESVLLNSRSVKANKVSHSWRERLVCCGSSFNCKRSDKPGCSVSADESCLICCSQIRIFCR